MRLLLPLRPPVVLALVATAVQDVAAQNIVANPSFEQPALAGNGDGYSNNAGVSLPGWTVATGPILGPLAVVATRRARSC